MENMSDSIDSWVNLTRDCSPIRVPTTLGELPDYLAMLREAQGETSCRVSPILTRRSSMMDDDISVSSFYVNRGQTPQTPQTPQGEFDWSSSIEKRNHKKIIQETEEGEEFYTRALKSILLSNLVSLLLGAGLGIWLYRRARTTQMDL